LKKTVEIANNYSDVAGGIHQGMININFLGQFEAFADLRDGFSNESFNAKAMQALETYTQEAEKLEKNTLQANPASLAKQRKAGPPPKDKGFKMIKVLTSPNNKKTET
jgi:hypothetical protein